SRPGGREFSNRKFSQGDAAKQSFFSRRLTRQLIRSCQISTSVRPPSDMASRWSDDIIDGRHELTALVEVTSGGRLEPPADEERAGVMSFARQPVDPSASRTPRGFPEREISCAEAARFRRRGGKQSGKIAAVGFASQIVGDNAFLTHYRQGGPG